MARPPSSSPSRGTALSRALSYEIRPGQFCGRVWRRANFADAVAAILAANLMIVVLFAAVAAAIAAGDVPCGRLCLYLTTWGSEVVLLIVGPLWVGLTLVLLAVKAGCWTAWQARELCWRLYWRLYRKPVVYRYRHPEAGLKRA